MKITERLRPAARLFLDSAPVIYFVERHPRYATLTDIVFDRIDNGALKGVASPITLAESLVLPYRPGKAEAIRAFNDLIA